MFQLIENEIAVVRCKGVYKEVQLATRNGGELYVKTAGGFVRLNADGTTSIGSTMTLDTLALSVQLYQDRFGRLCAAQGPGRKALTGTDPAYLVTEKVY